jgi:fatty-acyl-CoA synthase
MAFHNRLGPETVHLWTLPMFHCNGWCFTWAITAAGGTHVCLPKVEAGRIWRLCREEGVNSFNAAPTVLTDLVAHQTAGRLDAPVAVGTGGAPPSPTLLAGLAELNIDVTHLYGLTETFGPAVIRERPAHWDSITPAEQAALVAHQGNANVVAMPLRVLDHKDRDVPVDGRTIGEVAVRGPNVTLGYFRDPDATAAAYRDGWFRTGDLGVRHPGGTIELRDRAKDVIISGGENIASIEVEQVLMRHPAVLEAAVVARPDPRWGEVPFAFVALRPGARADEATLIDFVREHLAHFKAPRGVVIGELPKTATGKIQKFRLRQWAASPRA